MQPAVTSELVSLQSFLKMSSEPCAKRKRVGLTIVQKCKLISLLNAGSSLSYIANKFGVGRSTVSEIKKDKVKILQFQCEKLEMGMSRSAKVV